jgi:chromosome segregation ATPase
MIKKETDARREVTNKDLEAWDSAMSSYEAFGRSLYATRRILSEIGNLEEQYRGMKRGIEVVQAEASRISSELEGAKNRLAEVQQREVETQKRVAALTAEVQEKQRMLEAFTAQIDKITGRAA